jgi:glycosyltransferase involved in cell wall biosynthesis
MTSQPLLSIGLFVYNGEHYIREALDSFLGQTFRDFELIISDNASTDRTEQICKEYVARDARIRYSRNAQNMGAGWNVRRVVELATGKYFKWAACDDQCEPRFLERCVAALEADPSLVLAHTRTRVIDEQGNFIEDYGCRLRTADPDPLVRLEDLLLVGHRCYQIFGVIRMEALKSVPPQGSYVHSDRVLLLQLGLLGRYYEDPEFLFVSRKHNQQSVWTKPTRVSVKRFRLTNHHGTLPSPEWWDPAKRTKLAFPEWFVMREYYRSIRRAPLSFGQRLRGYGLLGRWIKQTHRRLVKDLIVAADQILYILQTKFSRTPELKSVERESA